MGNILTVIPIWTPKIKFNQFSHKREIPFSYRYGNYDIYERTHERPEHPVKKSKEIEKISKTIRTRCNQEIKNKSLKQINPEKIFALVKEIQALYKLDMTQVDSYMVNCLAKGIEALSKKINTLPKKQIHPDMISGFAKGIKVLNSTNPKLIEPDMISGLAKGIEVLNSTNPKLIEPDMISGLAKEIEALHSKNPKLIKPDMISGLAKGIEVLNSTNPKLIEPDMISDLAKGIEALIKNDKTKKTDFSSELKTLSKGLLEVINNNHKENNFKVIVSSLYDDLESLNKEINKSTTVEDFYVKPEEGCSNSWLEQMQKDTTAYGKIINENVKYERRSSEIFNFMQGFVVLEIIHDSQKDDLNEEQKANAEKRANQAIEDLDIYKIKLKDKKTFEANKTITIDDIVNEYGVKSQKDVGVKNSDIMIYKDKDKDKEFIYIYTHQYNASLADTAKLTYGDQFVYVKEGHTLQIENTDENKKALNNLIKLLKPHCHENSYAILTHLVHRAIERFGKSDNGYNLGQTIDSINELLQLKNDILNCHNSMTTVSEIDNLKLLHTLSKDINSSSEKNVKTNDIIKNLQEFYKKIENNDEYENCQSKVNTLIEKIKNSTPYNEFSKYVNKKKLSVNKKKLNTSDYKEKKNFMKYVQDLQNYIIRQIEQNNNNNNNNFTIEDLESSYEIKYTDNISHDDMRRFIEQVKAEFEDFKKLVPITKEFIEDIQKNFKDLYDTYKNSKYLFTLEYSSQGNKYNYNAYELTTELGTLVLDDKGKMTTIIASNLTNK